MKNLNNVIQVNESLISEENIRRVDLHVHTNASDGIYSPGDIVKKAYANDLSAIAITDHDTVAGIKEAAEIGRKYGIEVVKGIELSARYDSVIHLLGLFVDENNSYLKEHTNKITKMRMLLLIRLFKRVGKYGIKVTPNHIISSKKVLTMEKVIEYLNENDIVLPKIEGTEEINDLWCQWRNCLPTVEECIKLIHNCGGLAILAHPVTLKLEREQLKNILSQFADYGLDGIEIFHPLHNKEYEDYLIQTAEQIDLLFGGGSDYHGYGALNTLLSSKDGIPYTFLSKMKDKIGNGGETQ